MWNNTTFGDDSNVGSGFFNNNAQTDPPQGQSRGQLRRLQSVVPVCIRQIKDHPQEEFKLFGMPTQILTIVAMLKQYEVQSTKATYELEDHTGRIKAILWLENDNDASAPQLPLVKEGCYLRIYGSLRIQDGEKLLMVLRMNSVENPNEITSHLLDVIDVRLQAEALSKGDGLLAKIKKNNPGAELANSMIFMEEAMDTSSNNSSLTKLQEKVYNILRGDRSTQGVHRSVVCKEFPVNMHREVDATLEFLIGEGHVYSTIDNDHFKVTDSL